MSVGKCGPRMAPYPQEIQLDRTKFTWYDGIQRTINISPYAEEIDG